MITLSLPSSVIKKIIDDPTVLGDRLSNSTSSQLTQLGISTEAATHILDGYTRGFRIVFILNACLAAFATLASITMIKHKELTRSDDEQKKLEAQRALLSKSKQTREKQGDNVDGVQRADHDCSEDKDLEMGEVHVSASSPGLDGKI